ncbi:MAG: metal-dependent transcriptional regulator [Acidobacteria bacterium]|nr:metal-dependent transcriptional regulator [Acidobacteriota bacterium]
MEDYLEAIYCIQQGKRVVRVKNIADKIGVKMPTVTNMLKTLNQKGFIDYEKHEFLELTPEGQKIGKEINRRHQAILEFLINILGIEPVVADEEACRIEHGISADTLNRLIQFIDFIETCPRTGPNWLESFGAYREKGINPQQCSDHLKSYIKDMKMKIKHLENVEEKSDDAE